MATPSTSIPIGSLVLVVGATGFIASHVVRQLLERGYRVRGTVRDVASAAWLIKDHFGSYHESGALELVPVPDMAIDGAFDEAVKGVAAIAHLATIATASPNPHEVVPPTVASVITVLSAAAKEPSVKEVVFTSSIIAAVWPVTGHDTAVGRDTWNESAVEMAWAPPPYESSRAMATYAASKVTAEKEFWRFVEEHQPQFNVNVVAPSGVLGEPMNEKQVLGMGRWVATIWQGQKGFLDPFPTAFFVDVKDVALLHVAAILDPEVTSERLHVWGINYTWNDFLAVLRGLRPDRKFLEDWQDPQMLTMSTDQTPSLQLLKKWGGQDGWRGAREFITESVENPYFHAVGE